MQLTNAGHYGLELVPIANDLNFVALVDDTPLSLYDE